MERSALTTLAASLEPMVQPLRDCYEAGVEAPTLLTDGTEPTSASRLAGLFLKRSLTDLRSVWVLTRQGYTSPAAAVAAALFENALAVVAVTQDEQTAQDLLKSSTGDVPWAAMELSKILIRRRVACAPPPPTAYTDVDYEKDWRTVYAAYKWLCKIKHPTLRSAGHDAGSTMGDGDRYVVMAAPDTRTSDLPVKIMILMICLNRLFDAIEFFVRAMPHDPESQGYRRFRERMERAETGGKLAVHSLAAGKLPFGIHEERIVREWHDLNSRPDAS